ncbi:carbohydrate porin [Piscinibacter sp. XHJ-5]|uniref:maltoporin n=1 Tax=Piscinibacter sp. XHJ-5 TaxID=3037797 RepID=UPI002452B68B|nr:carbohydrate porin [Piscinibacter sp. XHJ-5]
MHLNATHLAIRTALATSLLSLAWPAAAVDWGGYFRAGPGASKKDSSRACYGLGGPGLKYRLGNECDIYGEFMLSQGLKQDGVDYKAALMTNLYNPQTDTGDARVGINQMYAEGKGFDIAPQTTFWIGKRFYGRADVHIVDTFYTNLSGVGAGADIPVGSGVLGVAYFKTDVDANVSGNRLNLDYSGLPVNPDGKLRILGTFTDGNFTGGKSGFGLTLQHTQDKLLGGANNLWLQFAQGSAGLDGNFGSLTADSDAKSWRIVESLSWQLGPLGGQAQVMYQNDKVGGFKTDSTTVGGRASYAVSKNFKLLAEAGYSQKKPDGSPTQKLAKLTFGPALSTGPGFWNRPELRLYVTTAKWNQPANAAAGPGGVTGAGDGKTTGTSYGAQVEMWF